MRRKMYVLQREDGLFYWKSQSISSYFDWKSFDNAHLFSTKKGAQSRAFVTELKCEVKEVEIILKATNNE